jgi:hypothetical protein
MKNSKGGKNVFGLTKLSSEMGKALIKEADESRKKRIMDQCVGEVETVIAHIDRVENLIVESKRQLDIYKRRLDAIQAGDITLSTKTPGGQVIIEYTEKALRPENAGC